MTILISSGNFVDEVCRGVWHFKHWLKEEGYSFKVLKLEYTQRDDAYKSTLLQSEDAKFLELVGTHLWHSTSPFRPKHKRKNWYFTVAIQNEIKLENIDASKIIYHTMKSPKKGGQHVNTTSSGVRAVYTPLGLEAICYDERSQHRNKSIALSRLKQKAKALQAQRDMCSQKERWNRGKQIVRGDAIRVFEGKGFVELVR